MPKHRFNFLLVAVAVLICLLPAVTLAQTGSAPPQQPPAAAPAATSVPSVQDGAYFISSDDKLFIELESVRDLLQKPVLLAEEQQSLAAKMKAVQADLKSRKRQVEGRFQGSKGDVVEVYCLYMSKGGKPSFQFSEIERKRRIASDFTTLLQAFVKASVAAGDNVLSASYRGYALEKERATLQITVGKIQGQQAGPLEKTPGTAKRTAVVFDFGDSAADSTALKAKLITGGREAWSLSADLLVDKASVLKYDSATKALVEREKPSDFHVGINYSFGDIAATRPTSFRDAIFLKALVSASDEPLSSYGLGLGLRGVPIRDVIDLSPFSVFAAYVWTEEDAITSEGAVLTGEDTRGDWRIGIAFNLSKALDWLK